MIATKPLSPDGFHIEKLAQYDQEVILIYIRAMASFNNRELKSVFEKLRGKRLYVIVSFNVELKQENGDSIKPKDDGSYNFLIIDVWAEPDLLIHVWFTNPPRVR